MQLTRAEEQIMLILWEMNEGIVNDIRNSFTDPRPAHNTLSTELRILERKGFVKHRTYGNIYVYYPLIRRNDYLKSQLSQLMERYFGCSLLSLISFLVQEEKITYEELEKLLSEIKTARA
jgi:BlaI family transcriptional regulator, penicillinase repressor